MPDAVAFPVLNAPHPRPTRERLGRSPRRWTLAAVGVGCVGLAAVGVFVPGMPTTIFLIVASWCLARSCPWLEQRLIRNRFFGPFLRYVDGVEPMPPRAQAVSLALMWMAIGVSAGLLVGQELTWPAVLTAVLGVIGTAFIVRAGRARR
jgi:uncharacterized membrane protein YbaN (DUF454 family)